MAAFTMADYSLVLASRRIEKALVNSETLIPRTASDRQALPLTPVWPLFWMEEKKKRRRPPIRTLREADSAADCEAALQLAAIQTWRALPHRRPRKPRPA